MRLGRAAPITPVAAALGTGAALAPPRWRGELLAFATLGQRPTLTLLPAVIGAALVGAIIGVLLLHRKRSTRTVFIRSSRRAWSSRSTGIAFVEPQSGVRILPNGELVTLLSRRQMLGSATADVPRFGVLVACSRRPSSRPLGLAMVAAGFRSVGSIHVRALSPFWCLFLRSSRDSRRARRHGFRPRSRCYRRYFSS